MKYIVHTSKLQCPHNGDVVLTQATDCGIRIENKYPVLKKHIIGAPITGCTANTPCVTVVSADDSCFADKQKFNNDMILTDKVDGVAITNTGAKIKVSSV